jgi:hypothetical protein
VIGANPLSYGLSALRQTMQWHSVAGSAGGVSFTVNVIVSIGFAVALFILAGAIATGRTSADLQ